MSHIHRRLILIAIITVLALILGGRALAQQPTCANTAGEPRTCVNFVLSPAELTGDFIVNNNTLPSAFNVNDYGLMGDSTFVGTQVAVYVQNIHDHTPEDGVLYTYQDVLGATTFPALGQTVTRTLRPARTYIRGTLDLTCDVRSYAGESVACAVLIDEAAPAENAAIEPGARASYILDPGAHTVVVSLSGDPAVTALWTPASITRTVNITASATSTRQTFRFDKAGHLIVTLNQPGVIGDFYIDGALIASQVASIDQYVTPGVSHRVEARNLTDPAANGVYRWRDATTTVYLAAGAERTVQIRLQRQYLKGFLSLTCRVTNPPPGETLACQPTIDGTAVEPIPVGESRQYTLDPGAHEVVVTLGPQGDWSAQPVTLRVTIAAGVTTRRTVTIRVQPPVTPTPTAPPPGVTVVYGHIRQNQTWRGEVHVIGDIQVAYYATLTILPGTVIRIAANSDIHDLNDYPPDELQGVNTSDVEISGAQPGERFPDEDHHISIWIYGRLNAVGTPDRPIIITSDSPTPQAGDWNQFYFERGTLSYAQVSYYMRLSGRSGATISNNVLAYSYAYNVGTLPGEGPLIENNIASFAFHELANIEGPAIVRNNQFGPNPLSYGVGRGGICIAIHNPHIPTIIGNSIHDCDHGLRLVDGANPALDISAILNSNTFYNNNQNVFSY